MRIRRTPSIERKNASIQNAIYAAIPSSKPKAKEVSSTPNFISSQIQVFGIGGI
jgi:hypothetical protein